MQLWIVVGSLITISQASYAQPRHNGMGMLYPYFPFAYNRLRLEPRAIRQTERQAAYLAPRPSPSTAVENVKTLSDMVTRKTRNDNYDSYQKFNLDKYEKDSPEWNIAMIKYLLDMKKHGHEIKELESSKPLMGLHQDLGKTKIIGGEDPIICKLEPYNVCYRIDDQGNMHPLGDQRPVRLLRIY